MCFTSKRSPRATATRAAGVRTAPSRSAARATSSPGSGAAAATTSSSLRTARSPASPHDKRYRDASQPSPAAAANMTNARAVEDHYTRRSLGETILSAMPEAGKDLEHLTPDDLAPVDEFHSGQRNATGRLGGRARGASVTTRHCA